MGAETGRTGRQRRRAVGPSPSGSTPNAGDEIASAAADLDNLSGRGWADPTELPSDDDERLRRDVPPHHGG